MVTGVSLGVACAEVSDAGGTTVVTGAECDAELSGGTMVSGGQTVVETALLVTTVMGLVVYGQLVTVGAHLEIVKVSVL